MMIYLCHHRRPHEDIGQHAISCRRDRQSNSNSPFQCHNRKRIPRALQATLFRAPQSVEPALPGRRGAAATRHCAGARAVPGPQRSRKPEGVQIILRIHCHLRAATGDQSRSEGIGTILLTRKGTPQSARGLAQSRTLRAVREPSVNAPASWTAVALHRFFQRMTNGANVNPSAPAAT